MARPEAGGRRASWLRDHEGSRGADGWRGAPGARHVGFGFPVALLLYLRRSRGRGPSAPAMAALLLALSIGVLMRSPAQGHLVRRVHPAQAVRRHQFSPPRGARLAQQANHESLRF